MPHAQPQPGLFDEPGGLPEGFAYRAELITPAEERALVGRIAGLPFRAFEFHGHLGKRRVVSFGWRYDFGAGGLQPAAPIPDFLLPLRARAAAVAGLDPDAFAHVLATEYAAGAGIGWHRDRPEFGVVAGVSLLSPCVIRLRRKDGARWRRRSFTAEPRSAYVFAGEARAEWQHSIAAVEALRYSVTFRTLAGSEGAGAGVSAPY